MASAAMLYQSTYTSFRILIRARLGLATAGCVALLLFAALLAAQFSGRQPATVAMDIGLSIIRLELPVIIVLMIQELFSREFERRYFLNTFSYPHPRHALLLGRFIAVTIITLGLMVMLGGALALIVWLIEEGYSQNTQVALGYQYFLTIGFIGLDLLLLTAVATLLAVIASTPSFVLIGTFGFLLVGRSFASVIELLTSNTMVVEDAQNYRSSVSLLSYALPDLSALDIRMVALYGRMEFLRADWPWLVLSNIAYTAGLLALATWALQRKRFA